MFLNFVLLYSILYLCLLIYFLYTYSFTKYLSIISSSVSISFSYNLATQLDLRLLQKNMTWKNVKINHMVYNHVNRMQDACFLKENSEFGTMCVHNKLYSAKNMPKFIRDIQTIPLIWKIKKHFQLINFNAKVKQFFCFTSIR